MGDVSCPIGVDRTNPFLLLFRFGFVLHLRFIKELSWLSCVTGGSGACSCWLLRVILTFFACFVFLFVLLPVLSCLPLVLLLRVLAFCPHGPGPHPDQPFIVVCCPCAFSWLSQSNVAIVRTEDTSVTYVADYAVRVDFRDFINSIVPSSLSPPLQVTVFSFKGGKCATLLMVNNSFVIGIWRIKDVLAGALWKRSANWAVDCAIYPPVLIPDFNRGYSLYFNFTGPKDCVVWCSGLWSPA